jgi:hypothetical protein
MSAPEDPLAWVDELLVGIDKDECESSDGWWETSGGARYGAHKLAELKAEIRRRYLT